MKTLTLASAALLLSSALGAQPRATASGPRLAPPLFSHLTWRALGPAIFGGRINDIEVARIPGQPDQIYVLPENGGVFKSSNGGVSWTPVFDGVDALMSMGDIAVAPSSPNTLYLGTGSGLNPVYYWGEGVFKSTDGGQTWNNVGLRETRHIGRIVVHPSNPDIAFVAAVGRMWGPNTERGLYRTVDGGRSWQKVLYVNDVTGASDVAIDPSNPRVVIATTYQRQRKGFGGNGIGPGSGMYKSVDGGDTWKKITAGLPTVEMGRIGLAISPVDPRLMYADVEVGGAVYSGPQGADGDCPPEDRAANAVRGQFDAGQGGIYRSEDGGETWQHVFNRSDQPVASFVQIRADPKERNRLYREGTGFYVSEDMGKTFRQINTRLHADYRSLWIDPDNNNHLIVGEDGGLGITWDRTATWEARVNLPIGEYWELNVDNRDPYVICGGTQDNGNWCLPHAVRNRNGISNRDAWSVGGGDGMFFQIDPRDTNYALIEVNSSTTANSIQRIDLRNLQRQNARPGMMRPVSCLERQAALPTGRAFGNDPSFRWAWSTPMVFSELTAGVVYAGANVLFKSADRGGTWKAISPDLTARIDRDTVRIFGKPIGKVNYSPGGGPAANPLLSSLFGAITWIGESPVNARVIYTGTDDGQVNVTRDGGATWTNVTKNIPGLPAYTFATTVQPSRHAAGRVYATFDGHFNDDENTYVFVSEDFGQSWRSLAAGLPRTSVVRIAEHPRSAHLLVVGHTRGVHFSNDRGATWQSLSTNMPTVPVRSVVFHPRDNSLVVGTYARGVFVLDDVGALEALTPQNVTRDAVMVSATRGRQWNLFSLVPNSGHEEYFAPNPEFDPVITYYVRDGAATPASVTIRDAQGAVIRTLSGPSAKGVNRVTWDMRMDPAIASDAQPGQRQTGGGGRGGAATAAGPLVLPGSYTVSVAIPGIAAALTSPVTIQGDPMDADFTTAARRTRQAALMSVYGQQKQLGEARTTLRRIASQGAAAAANERLVAEVDRLIGISGTLLRLIESYNGVPTADQRQQMAWLSEDTGRAMTAVRALGTTGGR
ncbi:MAG TPA: hypothetical protein VEB19_07245 [Gemmatimonadaceae bacterium]|nr:hypothetical protein [Gemmatimonadaceae bacterium]